MLTMIKKKQNSKRTSSIL